MSDPKPAERMKWKFKKKKYSYSKLHCIERKKKKSGFPAITVTF